VSRVFFFAKSNVRKSDLEIVIAIFWTSIWREYRYKKEIANLWNDMIKYLEIQLEEIYEIYSGSCGKGLQMVQI
jgi:hypothetical protein